MAREGTRRVLLGVGMLMIASCGPESGGPVEPPEASSPEMSTSPEAFSRPELLARGETIAVSLCSTCHSVDRTGDSPHSDAIPFRQLSWKYPVEMLAEPLAEGIVVGHPDMPQWAFDPYDIEALLAYIESIQEPRST